MVHACVIKVYHKPIPPLCSMKHWLNDNEITKPPTLSDSRPYSPLTAQHSSSEYTTTILISLGACLVKRATNNCGHRVTGLGVSHDSLIWKYLDRLAHCFGFCCVISSTLHRLVRKVFFYDYRRARSVAYTRT